MAVHPLDTLVVHPGALGDVLQAVPALRALTAVGHRLAFAGQPRIGELLEGLGVVRARTSFDTFGLEALFVEDPPPASLRSRLAQFPRAVSWFGARDACYRRQLAALIRESIVAPPVPEAGALRTVWEHLLDTLALWCRPGSIDVSSLLVPEGWRTAARAALTGAGADLARPFLLAHPGAGAPWKQSPAWRFARALKCLASEGSLAVILHEGPADHTAAETLASTLGEPTIRLVEPSLPELAGVLSLAASYIGSDSGVSHLAAGLGTPSIILYPPQTLVQWAPWSLAARPMSVGSKERRHDRRP